MYVTFIGWFFFLEISLKEGIKCDYEPNYCKRHGAIAFAIFPTNIFGKCDKKPTLHREFCQAKKDSPVVSITKDGGKNLKKAPC